MYTALRPVRPLGIALLLGLALLVWLPPGPAVAMRSTSTFPTPERIAREEALAEEQICALVKAERIRAGVPALSWDARLWQAARAHSLDMRDHQFIGHVSALFGDSPTRVHRAGIATSVLLENVARAYSVAETHFALMQSPGHKANILNPLATELGIGVRINLLEDGDRELYITQIFLRPPEVFDPTRTVGEVLRRVQQQRQAQGWLPLQGDEQLAAYARRTARAVSEGRLDRSRVGELLRTDLPRLGRYRSLRIVVLRTVEARLVREVAALDTPVVTSIGIGGAQEVSPDPLQQGRIDVVLVLAEPAFLNALGGDPQGKGEGYQY